MSTIIAGLPHLEQFLESKLPTFSMRFTTKVFLNSLDRVETEDLIRKRIDKAGGDGIKPFTIDAIQEIYRVTGGFPREVIKICDKLVREAAMRNITTITPQFVYQVVTPIEVKEVEIRFSVSKKQLQILEILNEGQRLTPSEIVERLDSSKYKDKNNAVRAVNNILKRLMKDGLVERQKTGNTYVYMLSGKAKTLFAKA